MTSPTGSVGGGAGGGGGGGDDDAGFGAASSGLGSRRGRGGGAAGDRNENDTVELFGVTLYIRGLPAMAQAQGLPPDYYSAAGAGSAAGASMGGNSYNADGVYILLRRALQLVGDELAKTGVRGDGSATSVLADGEFGHDTAATTRCVGPPPFVKPTMPLEIETEASGWGIMERSVGVESLEFLLDVLARVRPRIEAQLPQTHAQSIANFYTRAVMAVTQLRALVYHSMTVRLMPENGPLPEMVAAVRWYVCSWFTFTLLYCRPSSPTHAHTHTLTHPHVAHPGCREHVKDAMEVNAYVANVTAPLARVAAFLNDRVHGGTLPAVSRLGMWSALVSHIMERFVDGICLVKKCSVTGRGLMMLDAGHVYAAAARLGPTAPAVLSRDKGYVDSLVSAFYFDNDGDLLPWMLHNKAQYRLAHMRALLTTGIGGSLKKAKLKEVVAAMEALYLVPPPPPAPGTGPTLLAGFGI